MGYWKDYEMEQNEKWYKGYLAPAPNEKYVCASHFRNKYLQRYINIRSHMGTCSYCRKRTAVMDMADFMEYVGTRITNFLGPIDDENMYLSSSFLDKNEEEGIPGWMERGPYLAPEDALYYENVEILMSDFDLTTDDENLNDDIASCFNVNQWIRKDPTTLLMKDELMQSWRNFSYLVKTKMRYTFFRGDDYYLGSSYAKECKTDINAEVSSMVRLLEDSIDLGTRLYRGRPEDEQAPFTTFDSLTAPPVNAAKDNRMSPYGISMFYGSFDKETPIQEIGHYMDDKTKNIYIGEFEITKRLKVINLCRIPDPDFWMEDEDDWQRYAFLLNFHNEISKPTDKNDSKFEYIPSQVFCEYLRFIQKAKDGDSYDGIIYSSSITDKQNIALFYDNKTSAEILDLNDVKVYKVDNS